MYAIHITATCGNAATREWFDRDFQMHQRLCGTFYAYAHNTGAIVDHDGTTIGRWFKFYERG